jgi:hypothetical protein
MRETRLSGSEGGAGSIPVPTPIVAWAFQPMSGRKTDLRAERDALSRPRKTRKTLQAEAATPSSRT